MPDDLDQTPSITVAEDGPYLVTGLPLRRRRIVESEQGEPITWQTTTTLDADDEYALCRCGQSSGKPFCDGSHRSEGFDGTETAPESSYDERARTYEGTGVVMRDDRSICEHAGFCGNEVTNVWKMMKADAPAESVQRSHLIAMIERCPSGALTYRLEADGVDVEIDLRPGVGVVDDGPLLVTGGVPVERSDGRPFETRNRITLCRCGASAKKPLCDGSHAEIGFTEHG